MGNMNLWPIAWLSPVQALTLLTLLLLPLLQATTGVLAWNLLSERLGHALVTPARWNRIAIGGVLPIAVAWMAIRWLGTPTTAAVLESATWPSWVGLASGILVLCSASLLARFRSTNPTRLGAWAAAGGFLAIASWALIVSFQLEPGAWLERRTLRLSLNAPAFPFVILVQMAATVSLGSAIALHADTTHRHLARSLAAISSAVGCIVVIAAPYWLPPQALPDVARTMIEQGISGPSWPARWSIVTTFAWATFALAATITPKGSRTVVLLAALAACSSQALWTSYRGPWNVRGWLYENGLLLEDVRSSRRSPALPSGVTMVGPQLFQQRCASCHASTGPLSTWRNGLGCNTAEIRSRLEALREADRIGHPDRERMPPLAGADHELDALAPWLRDGNPCP